MGTALVTLPDGKQARITFDTQSQLDATVADLSKSSGPPMPTSSMGPAPDDPNANQKMYQQTAQDYQTGNAKFNPQQGSFFGFKLPFSDPSTSESFHEKAVPVLEKMAGALIPGGGWLPLALQSGLSGAVTGAMNIFNQQQTHEPVQLGPALKEGVQTAVGNFGVGTLAKATGALASKIFSSPLSDPQQAAAQFARENNAPFPLSSAAPESAAAKVQQASRVLLPGEIRTKMDADKVAQFLNTQVGTLTQKVSVFDDAARSGQQFLRQVFEPGETAIKNTFQQYADTVGPDVAIPTTNTLQAVKDAADQLADRGQTTGGLYQRLRMILKRAPDSFTPKEFDELYGGIINQAMKARANAGGEGRMVMDAITKDMDAFGKPMGASFSDSITQANAVRDQFRELRNIPQLQKLADDIGSGRDATRGTIDWMNTLFSSGNGKALSKLRELNPDLYHDLADAYLGKQIDGFAKFDPQMMGRSLNGAGLRNWFVANQDKIKEIYGAPQAKALDNFTNYAQLMAGASARAAKPSAFAASPIMTLGRAGGELASMFGSPIAGHAIPGGAPIMIPGEMASFVLARGLSDPSSSLFKVFTQGFSPGMRSFMVKSAGLAGGQAASGDNQR